MRNQIPSFHRGRHLLPPLRRPGLWLVCISLWLCSFSTFGQVTWDGGGGDLNWNTANNWNPNGVPGTTDDITIDCSCTITYNINADLNIDGSLTVASGTTLNMDTEKLAIGPTDNTASMTNNGIVTNSAEIKSKGTGVYGDGPTLNNYGSFTSITKFSAGNNNGGGMVNNYATGVIMGTNAHVDGQICNYGQITFTSEFLLHGGILCGDGQLDAGWIELKPNPTAGAAGAGNGGEIQGGSIGDGSGCTDGSGNTNLEYYVDGGGPYTFKELLDLYGYTGPEVILEPSATSSCGEPAYITLPIELAFFHGYGSSGAIVLEWATQTEIENDYFQIERSGDGGAFEAVGRVAGAGDSNEMLLYSFQDDRPLSPRSYYRLRQVDFDGSSSLSHIVSVDIWESSFATYPNPTSDMLSLQLPGGHTWQAAIYDIRGEQVKTWIIQGGFEQVSLGHLPAGEYVLKLQNGVSSEQTILIKSD